MLSKAYETAQLEYSAQVTYAIILTLRFKVVIQLACRRSHVICMQKSLYYYIVLYVLQL